MRFFQCCGAAPVARRFSMSMGLVLTLGGCVASGVDEQTTGSIETNRSAAYSATERDCLERAIYFESNRSSEEGMVAVGTVVMNRVASPEFPDTICGVVGQKNQFAPGVLSRHMPREKVPDIVAASEKVLDGHRHPKLDQAMFFHMAGLTFPYDNMHYQLVAGGNAFYEKR